MTPEFNEFIAAEFVTSVQQLVDALRLLRDIAPEKFYGTPSEKLLEGLESALDSYRHDQTS